MFLLRCLFWLGLVFSQIAQLEGTGAAPFFGQAGALRDVQQAGAFGQPAAAGVKWRRKRPKNNAAPIQRNAWRRPRPSRKPPLR